MEKKEIKKIIEDDYETMKKGRLNPDNAYRLHTVFRVMYLYGDKKTKKLIENFYDNLKKQYPDIADFLKNKS